MNIPWTEHLLLLLSALSQADVGLAFQHRHFPFRSSPSGRHLVANHSPLNGHWNHDGDLATILGEVRSATRRDSLFRTQTRPAFPSKKRVATAIVSVLAATVFLVQPAHAAAIVSRTRRLGWRNLWSAAMLLVSLGALPLTMSLGFGSLVKSLLVSAGRCALQVSLLGSIVLQRMMGVERPVYVGAWILGVGLITGREALSRIQYTYPKMNRNLYASILAGGITVLSLTLSLQLFGTTQPWFDPQLWIPIAGMLFGNTLNASALAASTITSQFATNSESVEWRLANGATTKEAIAPLLEESYRISLMPTINALAATGIIHIPGMMSGQILAGQSPQEAALHQIVISLLIATTALVTVQFVIQSSVRAIVESKESRLRQGVLEFKKTSATMLSWKSLSSFPRRKTQTNTTSPTLVPESIYQPLKSVGTHEATTAGHQEEDTPVLKIHELEVPRANSTIDLSLRPGDRVAISGKSGAGKSQILRTIIGLEKTTGKGRVSLFQQVAVPDEVPTFRSRVCLVPQKIPTLEGTPNQFYRQILRYHSQRQRRTRNTQNDDSEFLLPSDIAKDWNLEPEAFDQPWKTLSGGESQRASLAISVALQPDVLLLDESTSSLDEVTSLLVEKTLKDSNIPMIVVTHSADQLDRFCTSRWTIMSSQ